MSIKPPEEATAATGDSQKAKNLIRSQYKDIMVKVDEDVYYLDRLQLALESDYFEKLFIEDYADRNCELIEIPIMDTDTFSTIVDIIYGKQLKSVINFNNYVSLLMAMDYLQMEITPKMFKSQVKKVLTWNSALNTDVFRLYNFIAGNAKYDCVLPVIFEHLSKNLRTMKDLDEYLPISFDHFLQIISVRDRDSVLERTCCTVCAKWICHDLENRLPHAITLVNGIKNRFKLPFDIDEENLSVPLLTVDEHPDQDTISRYIFKLLAYNGPICSTKTGISEEDEEEKVTFVCYCAHTEFDDDHHNSVSKTQIISGYPYASKSKLNKFLKDGNFCDIIVTAGGKKYKLHRLVLKSACAYFEEIFSVECSGIVAEGEGIPALPSMDKEYFLHEIDQTTFDIVIDHIYQGKVKFSAGVIVRLFKAANLLRIDDLLEQCESWMMENSEDVCTQDVIEILNITHENVKYTNLNRFYVTKYIVDSWPEIGNLSQFGDLFKAITLPDEISGNSETNKAYLLKNINRGTLKLIINYIYSGSEKINLKIDNVVRVLRASEIFKMQKLMEKCEEWLISGRRPDEELNSKDLLKVLRFGLRNTGYEDLVTIYSAKYMNQWPEVDCSLLCSFPYDALENMLMSPDLYFDDPYKILDICSKWITHDAENRYHLVPQIALAINRNGFADCINYSIGSPPDLKNCSQDFVKSKLMEILSRTSVVPYNVSSNSEKKLKTEQPIFITVKEFGKTFHILNSNLDEITSLLICKYVEGCPSNFMSATLIDDNIFLICSNYKKTFFHVFNFSLKKTFSLALDSRFNGQAYNSPKTYTLLNYCNEIYCCIEDSKVLKYVSELNRWKLISESEPDKHGFRFTSDGNILYRMYKILHVPGFTDYIMEAYDVEQNSWISLPNVSVLSRPRNAHHRGGKDITEYKLTFMNDLGFAVLFDDVLYLLTLDGEKRLISLPDIDNGFRERYSVITQDEYGEVLYMMNNKLYRFSGSDQEWQLKRELPMKRIDDWRSRRNDLPLPYGNMIAIHTSIFNSISILGS